MSVATLKKAKNGYFYACWSVGKRSRRASMGVKEEAAAQTRFAQWLLTGGQSQVLTDEMRTSFTVSELWHIYWTKHVTYGTAAPATVAYVWKNLEPFFGSMTINLIDQDAVETYQTRRRNGKIGRPSKAATVRKELIALRACLNFCASAKVKLISTADLPVFDLPPDSEPKERWLSTSEIKAVLASAAKMRSGDRLSRGERFLWLALETAARKQAILDLTWDRVDFEIGVIHYDVPGQKKTKKRRVTVAISDALLPVLKRAYDERENDLVMGSKASVWATIQIIVERSGIVPARTEPRGNSKKPKSTGVSPHTFRHTAATHMARRGVPLYDIAGVLGNTLAVVEKTYAKHCPGRLRAAVNSISSGFLEAAE